MLHKPYKVVSHKIFYVAVLVLALERRITGTLLLEILLLPRAVRSLLFIITFIEISYKSYLCVGRRGHIKLKVPSYKYGSEPHFWCGGTEGRIPCYLLVLGLLI